MEQGKQADQDWPRIAVVGAGAVGCYFGGRLARAGAPVTLIGRPPHVEALRRHGLVLQGVDFHERIPVEASTEIAAAADADLAVLAVKTPDTASTAAALAEHLKAGAMLVSMQNGVDNVECIRRRTGIEAVAAVVYVAVAMTEPGTVQHSGRGDLIVGNLPGQSHDLAGLVRVFTRAGIPCSVSVNLEGELWRKLVMNCAYNAVSALTRAQYGRIVAHAGTRAIIVSLVEETVAVARAAGIQIPDEDPVAAALELGGRMMAGATSSTEQDLRRGRKTEIDALNGFVARRGAALGVPAPMNRALHALVKLLEDSRSGVADPKN